MMPDTANFDNGTGKSKLGLQVAEFSKEYTEKNNSSVREQRMGNFTLKYDKDKAPPIKVQKCPYLNCNDVFIEYEHLEQHKILQHGELPHQFLAKPGPSNGYFSKTKLAHQNKYAFFHQVKTYKIFLDLYLKANKERSTERQAARTVKRQAQAQVQAKEAKVAKAKVPKEAKKESNRLFGFLAAIFKKQPVSEVI